MTNLQSPDHLENGEKNIFYGIHVGLVRLGSLRPPRLINIYIQLIDACMWIGIF
jgi:hypothetical protein